MRKFAVLGMAVALAAGLSACSSSSKSASNTTTPTTTAAALAPECGSATKPAAAADFKPVKADTLSVVTSLPGPGFWEGSDSDPTKLKSGYEYDIAKCMQSMYGLKNFSVRNVSFDAIVAGTVTNYDLALSQVSITPERAKVVSFSQPYFESQQGVLTKSDKSITTLAEAKAANWGVQTATTAVTLLKNIGVNNPHTYTNLTDAYTALEAGQVDAVLIDTAINLGEAARSNGKFHVTAQFAQPGGPDQYGAILPKGSTNVAPVNAVFKAMSDSGQLKALTTKDLTADPGTLNDSGDSSARQLTPGERSHPSSSSLTPPGGQRRAVSRFNSGLTRAVIAEVAAVLVTVFTWAGLRSFQQSLAIGAPGPGIALAIEIALGVLVLIVPAYGARAILRSLHARRLAIDGRTLDGRAAAEDSRDDVLWVVGLGLVAAIVANGAFFLAGQHARVRSVLFKWDLIWRARGALWHGFVWNIKLFLVAEVLVLVWALFVAVIRQLPGRAFGPIRVIAIVYADVFRGIPTIIVIYLIVFGFPLAGVEPFASHMAPNTQLFWLGTLALVLVYGAYVAEVYRSGLESVHWSQTAAARSLGLSQWQTLRHVVIPQAIRRILPPLLNDFVALQKDTALVGLAGLAEILNISSILKSNAFNLSPVSGAAVFFLIVTIPFTRLVDYLIKRDKARTQGG